MWRWPINVVEVLASKYIGQSKKKWFKISRAAPHSASFFNYDLFQIGIVADTSGTCGYNSNSK